MHEHTREQAPPFAVQCGWSEIDHKRTGFPPLPTLLINAAIRSLLELASQSTIGKGSPTNPNCREINGKSSKIVPRA